MAHEDLAVLENRANAESALAIASGSAGAGGYHPGPTLPTTAPLLPPAQTQVAWQGPTSQQTQMGQERPAPEQLQHANPQLHPSAPVHRVKTNAWHVQATPQPRGAPPQPHTMSSSAPPQPHGVPSSALSMDAAAQLHVYPVMPSQPTSAALVDYGHHTLDTTGPAPPATASRADVAARTHAALSAFQASHDQFMADVGAGAHHHGSARDHGGAHAAVPLADPGAAALQLACENAEQAEEDRAEAASKFQVEEAKCHALEQRLEQREKVYTDQLAKLSQDLAGAQRVNAQVAATNSGAQGVVQALEEEMAALRADTAGREAFASNEVAQMEVTVARLQAQMTREQETHEMKVNLLTSRHTTESQDVVQELARVKAASELETQSLASVCESLRQALATMTARDTASTKLAMDMQERADVLAEENAGIALQLATAQQDALDAHTGREEAVKNAEAAMQAEVDAARARVVLASRTEAEAVKDSSMLTDQVVVLTQDLEKSNKEKEAMSKAALQVRVTMSGAIKAKEAMEHEHLIIDAQMKALATEKDSLAEDVFKASKKAIQLENIIELGATKLDEAVEQRKQDAASWGAKVAASTAANTELQHTVAERDARIKQLIDRHADDMGKSQAQFAEKTLTLQASIAKSSKALAERSSQFAEVKDRLEADVSRKESRIRNLEADLVTSRTEVVGLKEQLKRIPGSDWGAVQRAMQRQQAPSTTTNPTVTPAPDADNASAAAIDT